MLSISAQNRLVSVQDKGVEEESEWWEPEPVFKMHYQVTLEDGR